MDALAAARLAAVSPGFEPNGEPIEWDRPAKAHLERRCDAVNSVERMTECGHHLVEARRRDASVQVPRRAAVLGSRQEGRDEVISLARELQSQPRRVVGAAPVAAGSGCHPPDRNLAPVRVVAGTAKGRRLRSPRGDATRPTADAVRESIFNMLGSRVEVEGATAVDLFAGSGALGIEALSRGASSVVFVERDALALAAIEANLAATGLGGGTVVRADALRWLTSAPTFDLAFADPPYEFDEWGTLLERLHAGLAVLESDREVDLPPGWSPVRHRRSGTTVVTLTERGGRV